MICWQDKKGRIYMYTISYRAETYDGVFCGAVTVTAASFAEAENKATKKLMDEYSEKQLISLSVRS